LLEDVDRSDLRDVLQMRAAAGAVVRTPDFDHPKAPHGLRDEIQEGSIVDFAFHGDTVFLKDSDRLRRGRDSAAIVLDPLPPLRSSGESRCRRADRLLPHRRGSGRGRRSQDHAPESGRRTLARSTDPVPVPAVPPCREPAWPSPWRKTTRHKAFSPAWVIWT